MNLNELYKQVYYKNKSGMIFCGDCVQIMQKMDDACIDLTVTSPPYDDLRDYKEFSFDFESVANELYRITKPGGVVVWIVNDATKNGSETGTSFKQALYFKEIGFNINDTMIWMKQTFTDTGSLKVRYGGVFEYMFVFSKGKPKVFNPIRDRQNISVGSKKHGTIRQKNGSTRHISSIGKEINHFGYRFNVWQIPTCVSNKERTGHPAQFPEQLANDHIISWSNENDIVFDPFMGSGTTAKMAMLNNRRFIGCEISEEYCNIIKDRLDNVQFGGEKD